MLYICRMKTIIHLLLILCLGLSACSDSQEKAETDASGTSDSVQAETPLADTDTRIQKNTPTPEKKTSRPESAAQLEMKIEETGFQLEELKGQLSLSEQNLTKARKKKNNPDAPAEISRLEKEISGLKTAIQQKLTKLEQQQARLKALQP